VAGFIDTAGETAAASAERRGDIERGLQKLPRTLTELRLTMHDLGGFSRAATPVFANLGQAAPSLAAAQRQLAPFAAATNISLRSLGTAAEATGPKLVAADPTIVKLRDLAKSGSRPLTNLGRLLKSVRKTKGFERFMSFIYNNVGWANGFDNRGHFLRENFLATNCISYATTTALECLANFKHATAKSSAARTPKLGALGRLLGVRGHRNGGVRPSRRGAVSSQSRTGAVPGRRSGQGSGAERHRGSGTSAGARDVLNYLLGQ
jgi:ABC-type transporter Mla subunit MlaD